MNPPDVTLIGAGLAGSLLGLALARRGLRVEIYERRADLRRVRISAGRSINLALANRGIHALDEVGLMDRVRPLLIPMVGRMLHDERGQLQLLPYGQRPEEVIYSVSRGGLNGLLMDAAESAGVRIHFQASCRGVDFARRVVLLHDEAGGETGGAAREAPFRVLLGTDGSASAVRGALISASGGQAHEEPLAHGYKELSIPPGPAGPPGPSASPAPAGECGSFRMERSALHIWPRGEYMLIALPNIDGSFTVTLFLPHVAAGQPSFASLSDAATVRAFFAAQFADVLPHLPDLEEQFFGNPTGHLGTLRCWPWSLGAECLLLGDAAHAIVPFHGQGMNCAFEDVSALGRCLDASGGDWAGAFAAFAAERKPNAEAIADMALENYVEMRASVREPKFQLKKELSFRLEERFPGRFVPRYSMVMFHRIPYAEAKRRGAVQEGILDELTAQATRLDEVDWARAARLVEERLERVDLAS